jgi:hypothetical protein
MAMVRGKFLVEAAVIHRKCTGRVGQSPYSKDL